MKYGAWTSRIKLLSLLVLILLLLLHQLRGSFLLQQTTINTTWILQEDAINAPTFSDSDERLTLVHCVGENFLPGSSWHSKSCHYRNLCYHDQQQWTLRPSSTLQLELEEENNFFFFSSTKLQQNVSTIGLRPSWVRNKQYRWSPNLDVTNNADRDTIRKTVRKHVDRTVIIVSVPPFGSMITFLVDLLFPIFNLIELFHLQSSTFDKPILVNLLNIQDLNDDDIAWMEKGLSWMGYELMYRNISSLTTNLSSSSSQIPYCFSHAAAGIGMLTVTGLSQRGALATDYQPAWSRNHAGRGVLLHQFRNHVLRHTLTKKKKEKENLEDSSSRKKMIQLAFTATTRDNWKDLSKCLDDTVATTQNSYSIRHIDWTSHGRMNNTVDLMETAASSYAWIADANNENCTWPALFLPKGAHLILLYDSNVLVKNKKKRNKNSNGGNGRPIKLDFGLWNQLSHIHVHWLSLSHPPVTLANMMAGILLNNNISGNDTIKSDTQDGTRQIHSDSSTKVRFDGGMPLSLKTRHMPEGSSKVHCIGENWMWNAAHYRSCHVQHLCFDTVSKTFVLPATATHNNNGRLLPMDAVSTWVDPQTTKVMMGHSIRHSTSEDAWFPLLQSSSSPNKDYSYYALDPNVIWLPFFSEQPNISNPGHLLWDFWLPMFTLMELFLPKDGGRPKLLLTNLDSSCTKGAIDASCYKMVSKFLPLLGVSNDSLVSAMVESQLWDPTTDVPEHPTPLVCAENGLMGIGMLTDHGSKKHGQLLEDYQSVQNIGRGPMFWRFRNFMLKNLKQEESSGRPAAPWKITFSINSSQNPSRRRAMERQIEIAQELFPPDGNELGIVVESVQLGQLALEAQTKLMDETAVFVSVMGGSASTAMFLRRDTSLILYYNDIDDFAKGNPNKGGNSIPNRMDWDFWNNASYLRVHWLPIRTMDAENDLKSFARLLQVEVNTAMLLAQEQSTA
ncbi:unnamed protein product [Cylindrotheca closterium]|uniref:Protein xylosyltransferase n=1 Tax=Cylindrotheca closterium TaxID=2856 RepID=A0AAD2G6X3_9STRA|nr:unnamed protein product [Cylindrotheca closterium]